MLWHGSALALQQNGVRSERDHPSGARRNLSGRLLASPNPALAAGYAHPGLAPTSTSGSVTCSGFFSVWTWVFHETRSCSCTTTLSIGICINPAAGSHWVSPELGKMSPGLWAHARGGSSELCAREHAHTRRKRMTSPWASV